MRVGMAVNVPRTEEERENFLRLTALMEEASARAGKAGLWVGGQEASKVFDGIHAQLMNTWRHQ